MTPCLELLQSRPADSRGDLKIRGAESRVHRARLLSQHQLSTPVELRHSVHGSVHIRRTAPTRAMIPTSNRTARRGHRQTDYRTGTPHPIPGSLVRLLCQLTTWGGCSAA